MRGAIAAGHPLTAEAGARVLASGLLDDEYTYENLASVPGITEAQARTIAASAKAESARGVARPEVRVH